MVHLVLSRFVLQPKKVIILLDQKLVESVLVGCVLERKTTKDHGEEDDSHCKNVSFGGIVSLVTVSPGCMDLWSHVTFFCSFVVLEAEVSVLSFEVRSKTEVGNFEYFFFFG